MWLDGRIIQDAFPGLRSEFEKPLGGEAEIFPTCLMFDARPRIDQPPFV